MQHSQNTKAQALVAAIRLRTPGNSARKRKSQRPWKRENLKTRIALIALNPLATRSKPASEHAGERLGYAARIHAFVLRRSGGRW